MIVLFYIVLFSKSDCLLVLCCIYLQVLRATTKRVQSECVSRVVFVPALLQNLACISEH